MDQTKGKSGAKYTINYTGYKARLITTQEIAQIVGADTTLNWKEESENKPFSFDSLTSATIYHWLVERTSCCESYGCQTDESSTYRYWTASSNSLNSLSSWFGACSGELHYNCSVELSCSYGVRPVIIILKSKPL